MAGAHESMEHSEHASHAAGSNKKIALLIAVIALFLALSETLGKSAQTEALARNVEASNLWSFFQAKTVRSTTLRTAAEQLEVQMAAAPEANRDAMAKRIDDWKKTVARYDDEPSTGEGRKQLAERAQHAEHTRDHAMARYHQLEFASAAFQIGIVLASAAIITSMMVLAWGAGLLCVVGLAFTVIGIFAPHAIHLL